MKFGKFRVALAFVACAGQPVAASAQEICATQEEVRQVIGHLSPALIDSIVQVCAPYLPTDAGLLTLGPNLANQYRSIATTTDEQFAAIFRKIDGLIGENTSEDVPAEKLKAMIYKEMYKEMQSEECALADKFALDFAALPVSNVAGLIETALYYHVLKLRKVAVKWSGEAFGPSIFCE